MKIALFGTNQLQFSKVYTPEVLKKLGEYGELSQKTQKEVLSVDNTNNVTKLCP